MKARPKPRDARHSQNFEFKGRKKIIFYVFDKKFNEKKIRPSPKTGSVFSKVWFWLRPCTKGNCSIKQF